MGGSRFVGGRYAALRRDCCVDRLAPITLPRRLLARLVPCPGCGGPGGGDVGFCDVCWAALIEPRLVAGVVTLGRYRGGLGRALRALKYRGAHRIGESLADAAREALAAYGIAPRALVAVPSSGSRLRARGYNQAERIALPLAVLLGVPLIRPLRRRDGIASLVGGSRSTRFRSAAVAFAVEGAVPERSLLLVDDTLTTGATLAACRAALLGAGATAVDALAIARAERTRSADEGEQRTDAEAEDQTDGDLRIGVAE